MPKDTQWSPTNTYYSRRVEIIEDFFKVRDAILERCKDIVLDPMRSPEEREKAAHAALMDYLGGQDE